MLEDRTKSQTAVLSMELAKERETLIDLQLSLQEEWKRSESFEVELESLRLDKNKMQKSEREERQKKQQRQRSSKIRRGQDKTRLCLIQSSRRYLLDQRRVTNGSRDYFLRKEVYIDRDTYIQNRNSNICLSLVIMNQ